MTTDLVGRESNMTDHLERVGQTVSDYRLVRWLGGGGFGNVYLAERIHDGEQAALKMLEIRLTRSEDLRAFLNEARMMRLHHTHIVPLLDFGLSREEMPFLAMEYAPEGTLRDRHPKGSRVPLLTVVEYANQVASALSYAHTQRVVHRDVKPDNMLVRVDGTILLSDFGIATTVHSTHSLSVNQGIGGTIPYMAPEQLEGKPRTESDQYALGIVIYEWLAGRCPFRGTAVEVAMQHAITQPPSLIAQALGLPAKVEEVLFKALAKNPKNRFSSMQTFLQTLQDTSAYIPTLEEVSIDWFPKKVSSGVSLPATPRQPVDPPTIFPSPGVAAQLLFPPTGCATRCRVSLAGLRWLVPCAHRWVARAQNNATFRQAETDEGCAHATSLLRETRCASRGSRLPKNSRLLGRQNPRDAHRDGRTDPERLANV
jgi:serine/threonine protein kinase